MGWTTSPNDAVRMVWRTRSGVEDEGSCKDLPKTPNVMTPDEKKAKNGQRWAKWHAANPDKVHAAKTKYRDTHKDKAREYYATVVAPIKKLAAEARSILRASRREADKAQREAEEKERRRLYYLAHREAIIARRHRWYEDHADRAGLTMRQYYASHKDQICEYIKRYNVDNPDVKRASEGLRRSRKRSSGGRYTKQDIAILMVTQDGRCANPVCRRDLKDGYHADHIIPLSKGGSNWPENIQLLCPSCNLRKSKKHPEQWAKENGLLF